MIQHALLQRSVTRWLANREAANYRGLPGPDILFRAVAPLDVTLRRNALRDTPEPESFVRARYFLSKEVKFPGVAMFEVDTTRTLDSTLVNLKQIVWFSAMSAEVKTGSTFTMS